MSETKADAEQLPEVGSWYLSKGWEFRVEHTTEHEVYVTRFAPLEDHGTPMRVALDVWTKERGERFER